jgi:membrane protein implicated in regulation of membrane protease activity
MQSRRFSLIEAITNVVMGYVLAVATQIVVFPWVDLNPSLGENLALGLVFTVISLIRSYSLRRLFARFEHNQKRTSRSWSRVGKDLQRADPQIGKVNTPLTSGHCSLSRFDSQGYIYI